MSDQTLQFTAIRLTQPIGELFVGKISSDKLASLAKADIRRITSRELEKMSGNSARTEFSTRIGHRKVHRNCGCIVPKCIYSQLELRVPE